MELSVWKWRQTRNTNAGNWPYFLIVSSRKLLKAFELGNGQFRKFGVWSQPLAPHFRRKMSLWQSVVYFCGDKNTVRFIFTQTFCICRRYDNDTSIHTLRFNVAYTKEKVHLIGKKESAIYVIFVLSSPGEQLHVTQLHCITILKGKR